MSPRLLNVHRCAARWDALVALDPSLRRRFTFGSYSSMSRAAQLALEAEVSPVDVEETFALEAERPAEIPSGTPDGIYFFLGLIIGMLGLAIALA